jgi:ADP-ribose pyrophosphatase YjhB (NUDIX family)
MSLINGRQMYKIYINGTLLQLCASDKLPKGVHNSDTILITAYPGNKRYFLNYIDMMEKSDRFKKVVIHHANYKKLKNDFKSLFKVVPASGGMVVNEQNEILFIHRRGSWDLPKGKEEAGESKWQTAIREVEEETGIEGIELGPKLLKTKHMFRGRTGRRLIKKSYWYLMRAPKQFLSPQTEEDILEARWMTYEEWQKAEGTTYENIKLVLRKGMQVLNEMSMP